MGKTPRGFDDEFKRMAIELSYAKGSVKAAADELEMDPSLLSKWRRDPRLNGGQVLPSSAGSRAPSDINEENRQLRRALREMTMERDILNCARCRISAG